jgi:CheY-specific phosphatase CheX
MIEHKPLYQAMLNAVSQTLENMAFTEVIPHFDQNFNIPENDLAWASLVVKSPVQGEISLALPQSTLRELTGGIFLLGEDEITQEKMDDILHELLNTIAGLFMTKLLSDNQQFSIGLPEAGKGSLPVVDEETLVWKLMTSDESPLQVFLTGASLIALND